MRKTQSGKNLGKNSYWRSFAPIQPQNESLITIFRAPTQGAPTPDLWEPTQRSTNPFTIYRLQLKGATTLALSYNLVKNNLRLRYTNEITFANEVLQPYNILLCRFQPYQSVYSPLTLQHNFVDLFSIPSHNDFLLSTHTQSHLIRNSLYWLSPLWSMHTPLVVPYTSLYYSFSVRSSLINTRSVYLFGS